MNRFWWTVEIKTTSGRWIPHWGESTRSRARKAAMPLFGVVPTRIRGTDILRPGVSLRG